MSHHTIIRTLIESGREGRHETADGLLFRYRPAAAITDPHRLSVARRGRDKPTQDEVGHILKAIQDITTPTNLRATEPQIVDNAVVFHVVRITWYVTGMRRLI
ncbi:MAG: hypothetical protein IPL78_36365 [Chloroflexi bacterium]|nr:hypothetical protein [Chloroflexota bacterium]